MSILSKYGAYIALATILLLAAGAYGLQQENKRLVRELDASNAIIRQYQQAQALSESASNKLAEHKEATRNETARQNQIVNESLDANKTWADELLPDWVRGLLDTETSTPGAVPPTDGASR